MLGAGFVNDGFLTKSSPLSGVPGILAAIGGVKNTVFVTPPILNSCGRLSTALGAVNVTHDPR